MSKNKNCPLCGHGEFFKIDTVESPQYEFNNSMKPLGLTGFYGDTGEEGFFGSKQARMIVTMAAYVCRGCRHINLYATNLELLERMEKGGRGVQSVKSLP